MDNNAPHNVAMQLIANGFDIANFEDVHSAEVFIRDPETGAPTTLVIELAGPEHPARKRDAFARARKVRNELMKTGKMQLDDPEAEDAADTARLVDWTLGWRGLVSAGQSVTFGRDVAERLYSNPKYRWLRDQVKAAADERERFIKRSAVN